MLNLKLMPSENVRKCGQGPQLSLVKNLGGALNSILSGFSASFDAHS